jgi:hypothetical protein
MQIPVTDPSVTAAGSQLVDLLKGFAQFGSQATVSGFIVMAIQWLKGSKYFPWINQQSQRVNQFLSVGLAFATSLGINHVWNPNTRVLALTIPTLTVLLAAISHAAHGVLLNEGIYRAFVKKVTDAETRATHLIQQAGKLEVPTPVAVAGGNVGMGVTRERPSGGIPNPVQK